MFFKGTVEGCSNDIIEGNLLGLAPGGVHEAQFSDHKYKVIFYLLECENFEFLEDA